MCHSIAESRLFCFLILIIWSWQTPFAVASPPSAEPNAPAPAPAAPKQDLNHRFQVGAAIRAGTGYRVIMPYNEEFCGEQDKSVCGSRLPVWLEISPSFGITRSLELLVDLRFALEGDFTNSKSLFISPGIKYYADAEDLFKFFATGQVVFENQEQLYNSGLSAFDFGIRSALGLQFDILRYIGLYAQGGVILGFNRWLTFTVDFSGGVQVRY